MKNLILLLFVILFSQCTSSYSSLKISPADTAKIENTQSDDAEFIFDNKSDRGIEVKVVDKNTGKFIRGTALGPVHNQKVLVEDFAEVQLKNNSEKALKVKYKVVEKK